MSSTPPITDPSVHPSDDAPIRLPASYGQQQLWLLWRGNPASPVYNIARAIDITGNLDCDALRRAIRHIVDRHEVLRTTFSLIDGELCQIIRPRPRIDLEVEDLSATPDPLTDARCRAIESDFAHQPFDLEHGPLMRVRLLRISADQHSLLVGFHHSVFDGWSVGLFEQELMAAYAARRDGRNPELAELPIQYGDYAQWQRDRLRGPALDDLLTYWRKHLAPPLPATDLPIDRSRRHATDQAGDHVTADLPGPVAEALTALARRRGCTLFMALIALVNALLQRYSRSDDVVLGTPVANRDRPELQSLIGFFVNILVLRTRVDADKGFEKLLDDTRRTVLDAMRHAAMPFDRLVEDLAPAREPGQNPLFSAAFLYAPPLPTPPAPPGLALARRELRTGVAKFDLLIQATPLPDRIELTAGFRTAIFDASTARRILAHLVRLATAAVAQPDRPLGSLPLLDDSERRRLLVEFNQTATDYPRHQTLASRFAEIVARHGDRTAVDGDGPPLDYHELHRRSDQLAHRLRGLGVRPGVMVGLVFERQTELIVSILAVVKAGGAYVPLDPTYPPARLASLLSDAAAPVALTTSEHAGNLTRYTGRVVRLDQDPDSDHARHVEPPPDLADPTSPAYVMFTSGSTGTPKGVIVTHRNILRLIVGTRYADFGPDRTYLHLAAVSFDASTFEVWGPLLHGGKCVLCRTRVPTLAQLERLIREHRVDTLWLTAALFNLVIDQYPQALAGIDHLLTGGEALSVPHVQRALELLPRIRLSNGYGPTETTTFATVHPIDRQHPTPNGSVPIGRPIANTTLYVLDPAMQPVPIGIRGELYIGGDGVAAGYLHHPDLTRERFGPNPFSGDPADRLYRTGDIVRWRPDGTLEYFGRGDDQLKIHGFRIELGEIESVIARHPEVGNAAVTAPRGPGGERRLVAYVVPRPGRSFDPDQLLAWARGQLPAFMIPSVVVPMAALPMSPTGKIDRQRLPEPPPRGAATPPADPVNSDLTQDPVQRELLQLWRSLLRRDTIGPLDDFFDVGGHSLLAAHLFENIRQRWNVDLPLSTLLEHRTVAELAPLLSGSKAPPQWSCLVPLQPAGGRPPLWLVHGIGGDILMLRPLVPHFGLDQPLYGLQARGLHGDAEPDPDVPTMAARYIRAIRQIRPHGPYLLGGFSSGGAVALEMAQQLTAQGHAVPLLVMIDTSPPNARPAIARFSPNFWYRFFRNMPGWLREDLAREDASHIWRRTLAGLRTRVMTPIRSRPADAPQLDVARVFGTADLPERRARFIQTLYQGWRNYQPSPYAGRITVLRARVRPLFSRLSDKLGWDQVADDRVEVHIVPGTHDNLLGERHAERFTSVLLRCIDAALRTEPGPIAAPPSAA